MCYVCTFLYGTSTQNTKLLQVCKMSRLVLSQYYQVHCVDLQELLQYDATHPLTAVPTSHTGHVVSQILHGHSDPVLYTSIALQWQHNMVYMVVAH